MSRCCWMFNEGLVLCSMHLGVPFIAPKAARSRLSSIWKALVAFCPWAHWIVRCTTIQWTVCDSLPFLAKPAVATTGPRGTPDSPVRPSHRWLSHVSSADRTIGRRPGARLAHRTVRWIIAAEPSAFSWDILNPKPDSLGTGHCLVHTGQSVAPQAGASLACFSQTSPIQFLSLWNGS
jgi:hypothetical protein